MLGLAATAVAAPAEAMRLKPGDQIKVVVLGFEQYTSDYTVLTDGSVSGIGFGRLQLQGKTLAEAEAMITERLRRLIREPQVALVVVQEKVESLYVVRGDGELAQSATGGSFPFRPKMELRQLLAMSQLPAELDRFETRVYRQGQLLSSVDLAALMTGDTRQWNGPMEPGDLVTIMPVQTVRVWILGLVTTPGERRLRQGSDLYQALASAGAISAEASTFDELEIAVRRGPETFRFTPKRDFQKPPFILQEGDTVLVQPPTRHEVSISGWIQQPGVYRVRPGTSVSDLIGAQAGGLTPEGTARGVLVFRGTEVLVVDAEVTAEGQRGLVLEAGDSVHVMRNERTVLVLGEVQRPGVVSLRENRPYRLAELLSLSGGLVERGSLRRVIIVTPENGKMVAKSYNLDEFLKDGRLESNPEVAPGSVILFGQPRGITFQSVGQILNAALLLESLLRR